MALNFPSAPNVGDTFGRWLWNGVSWVTAPAAAIPYLPLTGGTLTGPGDLTIDGITTMESDAAVDGDLAVTGGVTADHVTTTGTSLDVAGTATIGGTLTVNGATEFNSTVEIGGETVATEDWTMQQVAAGGLWQGTWDAENNVPDLTQTAVQLDGYTWAVVLTDPTASFTIPATPVIPGLNGEVVWTGYHVIWSDSASEFQIVPGGGMSLTQAEDLFLAKTGGTITGNLTVAAPARAAILTADQIVVGTGLGSQGGTDPLLRTDGVGTLYISCGSNFDIRGGPVFYNDVVFQEGVTVHYGSNMRWEPRGIFMQGTGSTAPTATGNININSTAQVNGNITLTGAAIGQGNINMVRGTLNAYNVVANQQLSSGVSLSVPGIYSYQQGAPTYGIVTQVGPDAITTARITWPVGGFGNYVRFGGSEPMALSFADTSSGQYTNPISLQHLGENSGGLTFFAQRYGWWGTMYGSHTPGDANPKIASFSFENGTQAFLRAHSYAAKPGGGPWSAMSDVRTKTDVHDYTAGLAELTKLNPIRFRYNGRARMPETGKSYVGLHAEEAKQVMPEMVIPVRGKLDYDEPETDILHLDANALTYAMINAVKEITKRLEALEAKIK